MVVMHLKDHLKIFVKRREFLPREMTLATQNLVASFLPFATQLNTIMYS